MEEWRGWTGGEVEGMERWRDGEMEGRVTSSK